MVLGNRRSLDGDGSPAAWTASCSWGCDHPLRRVHWRVHGDWASREHGGRKGRSGRSEEGKARGSKEWSGLEGGS